MKGLIEKLKGKTVLLFGEPASGKSFTIAHLSRKLLEQTGKPGYLIWLDTNLFTDYGNQLEEYSKANIIKVTSADWLLRFKLPEIFKQEKFDYSLIALDSLSGLEEIVTKDEKVGSPRRNLLLSQTARILTYWLSRIAQKWNIPAFLIAHSSVVFEGSWRYGVKERPAFSRRAIKNVDCIIYHKLKPIESGNGTVKNEIVWKVVLYRSLKETIEGLEFSPLKE